MSAHAVWALEHRSGLKAAILKGILSSGLGGCWRTDLERACWCIHPVVSVVSKDPLPSVDSEFKQFTEDALDIYFSFN